MPVAKSSVISRRCTTLLAVLLITLACSGQAGGFRITPLRINFDELNQTTQLSIENLSDKGVTLQASLMRWHQDAKGDQLEPSDDIFISPPIVLLPPSGKQILRLRYTGDITKNHPGTMKAYRLYLQDTAAKAQQTGGASLAVRIGLPVFVTSSSSRAKPEVDASYQNGYWLVTVHNKGDAQFRVLAVDAFSADADRQALSKEDLIQQSSQPLNGFPYVFPGHYRQWKIAAPGNAQIRLRTDVYGYQKQGFDRKGISWLVESGQP